MNPWIFYLLSAACWLCLGKMLELRLKPILGELQEIATLLRSRNQLLQNSPRSQEQLAHEVKEIHSMLTYLAREKNTTETVNDIKLITSRR